MANDFVKEYQSAALQSYANQNILYKLFYMR